MHNTGGDFNDRRGNIEGIPIEIFLPFHRLI